jgi:glycerol-3-phosphate cytidylyltransferase
MRNVLTHGTFDIPHAGHALFLYHASKLGDFLMVGLSSDEYALTQGKKTIYSYEERRHVLLQMPFVDHIYKNELAGMKEAIIDRGANVVAIGSDWGDKYFKQISCDRIWFSQRKIELVYIPYTDGISTTDIKRRLK